MDIDVADRSFLMVFLLEACNFDCAHCVREEEPMAPGYRLTFRQLRSCLSDCRSLGSVRRIHFSGGEPTLWREGNRRLVDLLIEIAAGGFVPGFTTNGSRFEDYDSCESFFREYAGAARTPLRLYLSIDDYHANYDRERGRAPCLDHVLRWREGAGDRRDILEAPNVIVTVSKEPSSGLPAEMVAHYEARGVRFVFSRLRPAGRARSLRESCPEPEDAPESPATADFLILIGDDYYFHLPVGDAAFRTGWRRVGRLGLLPRELVRSYRAASET